MSRAAYLRRQRWFVGTDREVVGRRSLPWSRDPDDDGFGVRIELVDVRTATGGLRTYQVPASYRREPFPGLENALMDEEDGYLVYDALLDAHARGALLADLAGHASGGRDGAAFASDDGTRLDPTATTVPLVAEQSNTSVVVGDSLLWKSFRIVGSGPNPDIELGRALTATGADCVAPVRGWVRAGDVDLAMFYDYFPSATDGWASARASVRDLLADPGPGAAGAGADFAAESARLGAAVARMHELLRGLGTASADPGELADRLRRRFEATSSARRWGAAASTAFDQLAALAEPVTVQRVHGDLHLGQTLRTIDGWRVFDLEGEPSAPLALRREPDTAWRDVAGMLRSLDYAPWSVGLQVGTDPAVLAPLARDWTTRNASAFLGGYGASADPATWTLLRCHQIDKAAYEVDYELAHRPAWASIPRDALHRLLDSA